MKQKTTKTVQKIAHKTTKKRKPADPLSDFDASWSFLDDESEVAHFQHEYEFAPEVRFFN
jgi:hypothetical protein